MRGAFRLASPLLCLLLAACWTGPILYSRAETRAPIPPGVYRSEALGFDEADAKEAQGPVRVSVEPSGLTRISDMNERKESSLFGFAPLDGDERYVAWTWIGDEAGKPDAEVLYLLMVHEGAGYRLSFPGCRDKPKELAIAAGAVFHDDPKAKVCRFPDRAALERGIRALADLSLPAIRLEPAGG